VLIPIDGYQGGAEHAPFNAIIVTAAPDHIPSALIAQLKPGGRMVIPVGRFDQELIVLAKHADGSTTTTAMAPVRFVPLSREQGRIRRFGGRGLPAPAFWRRNVPWEDIPAHQV
jgi:protein-L-isoaspartate O-methyltransferase